MSCLLYEVWTTLVICTGQRVIQIVACCFAHADGTLTTFVSCEMYSLVGISSSFLWLQWRRFHSYILVIVLVLVCSRDKYFDLTVFVPRRRCRIRVPGILRILGHLWQARYPGRDTNKYGEFMWNLSSLVNTRSDEIVKTVFPKLLQF